jgi:LysM repeat protein
MEEAMAMIGIRLADGKFFSILEEGAAAKKRLIVTTVKDDQPSVQIDVYQSADGETADAYVGSLIIENIPPRPSGEPDIRLDLGVDEAGNLNAFAREEVTGEHQALSISLKSLSEEEKYDIPDFDFQGDEDIDLNTDELPDIDAFDNDIPEASGNGEEGVPADDSGASGEEEEALTYREKKKPSAILVGVIAAIGTAIILIAAFFIYTCTVDRQPEPPVAPPAAVQAPVPAPEPPKAEPPAPVPQPEPAKVEPPAPAKAEPVKPAPAKTAPAKKTGTWYKIRWGDTLWDLSIAYYRTPWLYKTIAKANKIRNPDLIISGTWIFIPPR